MAKRTAFYDSLLRNYSEDLAELIIHPGKNVQQMQKFTGSPIRRHADYLFFRNEPSEKFADDCVSIIGWKDIKCAVSPPLDAG